MSDHSGLIELIDLLRKHGVTRYQGKVDGKLLELELGVLPTPEPVASKPEADPDLCECGHGPHEHNNGFCLQGCEPEKCHPEEKP